MGKHKISQLSQAVIDAFGGPQNYAKELQAMYQGPLQLGSGQLIRNIVSAVTSSMSASTAMKSGDSVPPRDLVKDLAKYLNDTNQPELATLALLINDIEEIKKAHWFSYTMYQFLQAHGLW